MTTEIEHHDRNEDELPTTEEIIEQLQERERDPVDGADMMQTVEGDVEIFHDAADGHVILRYRLWTGWDMNGDFRSGDGTEIHDDDLKYMTTFPLA